MKDEDVKYLLEEIDKGAVEKANFDQRPAFYLGMIIGGLIVGVLFIIVLTTL